MLNKVTKMSKLAQLRGLTTQIQTCKNMKVPLCHNLCIQQRNKLNTKLSEWLFLYNHRQPPNVRGKFINRRLKQTQQKVERYREVLSNVLFNKKSNYLSTPKHKRISPEFLCLLNNNVKSNATTVGGSFIWHRNRSLYDIEDLLEEIETRKTSLTPSLLRLLREALYEEEQKRESTLFGDEKQSITSSVILKLADTLVEEEGKRYQQNGVEDIEPISKMLDIDELTRSLAQLIRSAIQLDKENKEYLDSNKLKQNPYAAPAEDEDPDHEQYSPILKKHLRETMEIDCIANHIYGINFYGNPKRSDYECLFNYLNMEKVATLFEYINNGEELDKFQLEDIHNFLEALGTLDAEFMDIYLKTLMDAGYLTMHVLNFLTDIIKSKGVDFPLEQLNMIMNAFKNVEKNLLKFARMQKKQDDLKVEMEYDMKHNSYIRHISSATVKSLNIYIGFDIDPYGFHKDGYYQPWNVEIPFETFKEIYQMDSITALNYLKTLTKQSLTIPTHSPEIIRRKTRASKRMSSIYQSRSNLSIRKSNRPTFSSTRLSRFSRFSNMPNYTSSTIDTTADLQKAVSFKKSDVFDK